MTRFTFPDEEYHLIVADLMRAKSYLDRLESTEATPDAKVVREALTLAATISYCRPFKRSRHANGKPRPWIPTALVDELPDGLRRFHQFLISERDMAWAHTDWGAHTPESHTDEFGTGVISRNPWVPFAGVQIRGFKDLIGTVDMRLTTETRASDIGDDADTGR